MEVKVKFWQAYGRMWKKCFNYRETATRHEYWYPFCVQALLFLVAGVLVGVNALTDREYMGGRIACYVLAGYLTLCLIPWISLTVRRIRETGSSIWWTLALLVVGIGFLFVMWICSLAPGNSFQAVDNSEVCVYGPPSYFDIDDYDDMTIEEIEEQYPVEIFNEEDNENVYVYGPPEWFD